MCSKMVEVMLGLVAYTCTKAVCPTREIESYVYGISGRVKQGCYGERKFDCDLDGIASWRV
jgi:hypothetical protein